MINKIELLINCIYQYTKITIIYIFGIFFSILLLPIIIPATIYDIWGRSYLKKNKYQWRFLREKAKKKYLYEMIFYYELDQETRTGTYGEKYIAGETYSTALKAFNSPKKAESYAKSYFNLIKNRYVPELLKNLTYESMAKNYKITKLCKQLDTLDNFLNKYSLLENTFIDKPISLRQPFFFNHSRLSPIVSEGDSDFLNLKSEEHKVWNLGSDDHGNFFLYPDSAERIYFHHCKVVTEQAWKYKEELYLWDTNYEKHTFEFNPFLAERELEKTAKNREQIIARAYLRYKYFRSVLKDMKQNNKKVSYQTYKFKSPDVSGLSDEEIATEVQRAKDKMEEIFALEEIEKKDAIGKSKLEKGKIQYFINKNGQLLLKEDSSIEDHYFRGCKDLKYLPPNMIVAGNLDLSDTSIIELPIGLKVCGNLVLNNTRIKSLTVDLKVNGDIYLEGSDISSIPRDIEIKRNLILCKCTQLNSLPHGLKTIGNLDIRDTEIVALPTGVKIGGNLYYDSEKISELPDDIIIGEGINEIIEDKISHFINKDGLLVLLNEDNIGSINLSGSKELKYLPTNMEVNGHLDLCETSIVELPIGLKVWGTLWLNKTRIKSLPVDLQVEEDIYLEESDIISIPRDLKINGDLCLGYCKEITFLPDDLQISGSLDISETSITELPNGLKIGDSLWLSNTKISKIPSDLIFASNIQNDQAYGGDFNIHNTCITEIPEEFEVKGKLQLSHTNILYLPDDIKVGGSLLLYHCKKLTHLPENLEVNGDLYLDDSGITELPTGLTINGSLRLENTAVTELPLDLCVSGSLYLKGTKIHDLPDDLNIKGDIIYS